MYWQSKSQPVSVHLQGVIARKEIPHTTRRRKGFTLVELLVAITILTIILLALGSAMSFVTRLWVNGIGAVDNFTKARVILNLLDRDIQMMVLRPDVGAFVNQNGTASLCAFYTNVQGNPGSGFAANGNSNTRTVSLVQYLQKYKNDGSDADATTLYRFNYGMNYLLSSGSAYAATPLLVASSTTPSLADLANANAASVPSETLATGVLFFKWQFIDGTGTIITPPYTPTGLTTQPNNWTPFPTPFYYDYTVPGASYNPRAVIISILVMSNNAYQLTEQTHSLNTIQDLFPLSGTTLPANQTYSQYWNSILNPASGTFGAGLPPAIRDGIQVFQRYIPLPTGA